jgi:tryptophanyl-tRNA synthetase
MTSEKRLCGLRPTEDGRLHLGHLSSVIRPAVEHGCDVLIADFHAPDTIHRSHAAIHLTLERFGVPAGKIICQRDAMDLPLYFRLLGLAKMGELSRMTQYKDTDPTLRTAHLLTYPVLMAHDVARYDAVYVGDDQRQHLEYAEKLLRRAGLNAPRAEIVGGRVMDLKRPKDKMSKSSPEGCLFLDDDADTIRQKIRKANTTFEGAKNLAALYMAFVGGQIPGKYTTDKGEGLKDRLAEALVKLLCGTEGE